MTTRRLTAPLSAISYQLSAISYQLSAVSGQLSAFSSQFFIEANPAAFWLKADR
jgi:hypothetical protein